jgi:predicted nucleic acid-binding protein
LIIDSSIAVCWLLPDEQHVLAEAAIREVVGSGADVPAHFILEVANVLLVSQRRKRINSAPTYFADLLDLEIRTDTAGATEAAAQTLVLADRHGLTVYDAAYLELARRLGAPLATLDQALRRAAQDAGVPLFDA